MRTSIDYLLRSIQEQDIDQKRAGRKPDRVLLAWPTMDRLQRDASAWLAMSLYRGVEPTILGLKLQLWKDLPDGVVIVTDRNPDPSREWKTVSLTFYSSSMTSSTTTTTTYPTIDTVVTYPTTAIGSGGGDAMKYKILSAKFIDDLKIREEVLAEKLEPLTDQTKPDPDSIFGRALAKYTR